MEFGFRALRLNVADVTVEDALRDLASPSPALRTHGVNEVIDLLWPTRAARPPLAAELQGRVLQIMLDGAEPWPAHPAYRDRRPSLGSSTIRSDEQRIVILTSDDLVPEVVAYWTADPGVTLLSGTEIRGLDEPARRTTTITVWRVVALEPFAWIRVEVEFRNPLVGRRGFCWECYSGTFYSLTLMRTAGGWQLLAASEIAAN